MFQLLEYSKILGGGVNQYWALFNTFNNTMKKKKKKQRKKLKK